MKRILPDAHTDFIFAATAEEFGIGVCIALVLLFALIVLRTLSLARRNDDPFCRLAATGLVTLFGVQACINMMVNVHLLPAKGHDAALCFLRWFIAMVAGARHGLPDRAHPQASARGNP